MNRVLMLLLVALAGTARGEWKETGGQELLQRQAQGESVLVVDVRSPAEYANGHVPGAINIPHDRLTGDEPALQEWRHQPVVLYCHSGRRAALAESVLEKKGFQRLEHLAGDIQAWEKAGRPVAR